MLATLAQAISSTRPKTARTEVNSASSSTVSGIEVARDSSKKWKGLWSRPPRYYVNRWKPASAKVMPTDRRAREREQASSRQSAGGTMMADDGQG